MGIEYKTIEGAPGRYFDCPAGLGLLSDTACGNSHRLSRLPASIATGRRYQCRNCTLGRLHADGKDVGTSIIYGRIICARCERGANRLIYRSICISCYNRQRELKIGKNARGGYPSGVRKLTNIMMLLREPERDVVRRFDSVTSVKEAVLGYLRSNEQKIQIGWCGEGI